MSMRHYDPRFLQRNLLSLMDDYFDDLETK